MQDLAECRLFKKLNIKNRMWNNIYQRLRAERLWGDKETKILVRKNKFKKSFVHYGK